MPPLPKMVRICDKGHWFVKSSDCPVCPTCEKEQKQTSGFLSLLGAPARRALENKGITSVEQLAYFTQKEIMQLHGMGKSSLPILIKALAAQNLTFRTDN